MEILLVFTLHQWEHLEYVPIDVTKNTGKKINHIVNFIVFMTLKIIIIPIRSSGLR